ncbi:MAG TPA: DedA family protein [Gemmatimonadota bacterium]|nr:DedA family protein [Gemmatimonadota bacterium]
MQLPIDLFLHLDRHLAEFIALHGPWVYGLLFLVVFAETGLVVTPFLPGDSLLFAVGALAARGALDLGLATLLLLSAAILGDTVNYAAGHFLGPRILTAEDRSGFRHRLLNRKHLDRTHAFFERYGGKAVVLGRFVPIVRTFVPFVAGAGSMRYSSFLAYNVIGGLAWVGICVGAGYAFGNVPAVKDNFSFVVIGIVAVSMLPMAIEFIKGRRRSGR